MPYNLVMLFNIKDAGAKGKGVFAARKILAGEQIWTFGGTRHSWAVIAELIAQGVVRPNDPFQISEDYFLRLDPTANYFNHSCEPNAGLRNGRILTAIRDIKKGEEICYDYSTVVCRHCAWSMACACGTISCRKKVGTARSLSRARLEEYRRLAVVPAFIAKELRRS